MFQQEIKRERSMVSYCRCIHVQKTKPLVKYYNNICYENFEPNKKLCPSYWLG